jgi:hypothetical protein
LVLLAEVMRRFPVGFPVIEAHYLYPLLGEWTDRFAHSLRAVGHHLPISDVLATVTPALVSPTGPGVGEGPEPFRPHEDYAGNPIHALLFLAALLTAALRWRGLPARAKVPPAALLVSWFLVHALLRENAWFSRLETPLFMLAPAALCVLARGARPIRRAVPVAVLAVAVPLLAYAFLFSALNELRPLSLYPPDPVASYYRARPGLQEFDDATLAIARSRNCPRLGVSFDGKTGQSGYPDPWDYPLLWRARAQGIEVRHVTGEHDWPCLILCMFCTPSEPSQGAWVRLGRTSLFARSE